MKTKAVTAVFGLHHITLLTKDLEQNYDFYVNFLGFRFIKNSINQENPKMRHVFYGDYLGTPGTATTFIQVPLLGHRTDGANRLSTIYYDVPQGSYGFWQKRLEQKNIEFHYEDHALVFHDPDGVKIGFIYKNEKLRDDQVVPNDIPADYQIIRLNKTELYGADYQASLDFFKAFDELKVNEETSMVEADHTTGVKVKQGDKDSKTRFGRGSIDHIAFDVGSKETLDAVHQFAKDQHMNIEEYIDRGWFYSLYVKEPNGTRIEFATGGPGFTLDEPLDHLGEKLRVGPRWQEQRPEILAYHQARGVFLNDEGHE
ncbi:glyoxalase [Secundilactobacillus malefermentans]|nr:glyoxalase [Secundilactobacillus malefermentans]